MMKKKNKYQEALNYFDWNCEVEHKEQQDLIQKLVDKETPMKPITNKYGDFVCGKCGNLVWENFTPEKHERCCDRKCGQVVDWSDEE